MTIRCARRPARSVSRAASARRDGERLTTTDSGEFFARRRFLLMVNKQGQTRLAQYFDSNLTADERRQLEGTIVRRCIARGADECAFVEHREYTVIYRRYASLYFVVGCEGEENELAMLEFVHGVVETLDRHFGNVCELDIMMHLDKVYCMLEEMVMCGNVVETNKQIVIAEASKAIDVQRDGGFPK